MMFANIPSARQRAVMRGRARITHKYSIEITHYDFDGVYLTEVIWSPHPPSPSKWKVLAGNVSTAVAPFYAKALEAAGLLEDDAS